MKLQVVTPWFPDYANAYSGEFVKAQVRYLEQAGHDVSVEVPQLFPAPPGLVPERVIQAMRSAAQARADAVFNIDGPVTYIPVPVPAGSGALGRAQSFQAGLALKREHLDVHHDLTHAHLGLPTGLACLRLGDCPVVVTEHQSTLREILSESACVDAYAEIVDRADAFLCVSRTLKNTLIEFLGSRVDKKISVVPNIVDTESIQFVERDQFEFSKWIYVGRLVADKGIMLLARAFFAYVRNVDPAAHLTVVGTGPLERWIRRFVDAHGLEDSVSLEGQRAHSDIGRYLVASDVFVHLSPHETFGVASLESISAGTPVVSLRNGGAEDTWGDIEHLCGLLLEKSVTADDVASAVAALRMHSDRFDLRRARSIVEQRFSGERVAEELSAIYERVGH